MKVIVSFSGGMDSATLLAQTVKQHGGDNVRAAGFTYGSKHNRYENDAAAAVAAHYKVPLDLIDLSDVMARFKSDLLKSGGAIPEGHYETESMRRTVVPCRNLIFASVLAGLAESLGCELVCLGVHSGDHHIYPDCRPAFVRYAAGAVRAATDGKVRLSAPFLYHDKRTILRWGLPNGVPYHLTRTCYADQEVACGKCGSCIERREAFMLNGAVDPVPYEYNGPLPEKPK